MTESWTVLEGALVVTVDGNERTLVAGDTATVVPGTRHRFHAPGPARWRQVNEPALQHEVLFRLDADVVRRHGSNGRPGPLQTIRILAAADAVFIGPPLWLQRALRPLGQTMNRRLRRMLSTIPRPADRLVPGLTAARIGPPSRASISSRKRSSR
jgi:hypothetical protein